MGQMGVFSESPKSFKIDRKSPFASNLKSSISLKLLQFLGNYTDDVLAEYITVLVCNGKHQNQARDDLEAFLGERSAEFVTWLWDFLFNYACQSQMAIGLSDPKDVSVIGTHESDADKDRRTNRLRELQNNGAGNVDSPPTKDGNFYHLSTFDRNPLPSNDIDIPEGVQQCPGFDAPLNDINTKKASLQTCEREIRREMVASGNIHCDSLAYESSRVRGSSKIPAGGDQTIQCANTFKKIVNNRYNGLPSQLLYLPKREPVSKNKPSLVSEIPHPRQSYAADVSGRSLSPKAVGAASHQNDKSRGSVWDRLGKPRENTYVRGKIIDAHGVNIMGQGEEVRDQHTLLLSLPNDELNKSKTVEASRLAKRCGSNNNPGEYRKSEHGVSTISKLHGANNIGRKRHFGEIGTGPATGSVSLLGEKNMGLHDKEYLQDSKRSTLTTQASDTSTNLVSGCCPLVVKSESKNKDMTVISNPMQAVRNQVVDVKLRLHQIETEMSNLRSRQAEMEKDGKSNLFSSIGALKHPEEDIESRTVFVTNVHFAATKEALSLYFSKCGVVINIVILADKVTAQPKGSAYVTFADKESVERAMELSGSSFFSRTIKVLRKAEAAAMISVPAHLCGRPSQARFSYIKRKVVLDRPYHVSSHLQWRRESASVPSEPSASPSVEEKRVGTSASMQPPPFHSCQRET
ncbi:hypothetical protein L1049_004530 [Liquidambar formosana]|uniref:RRM domain-containing protein n=1 Tax=Liquidambar formosana TaxID=63359 RepID=A0AAP0RSQ6_LIQFO